MGTSCQSCKACPTNQSFPSEFPASSLPTPCTPQYPPQLQSLVQSLRNKHQPEIEKSRTHMINGKLYKGVLSGENKEGYGQLFNGLTVYFGNFYHDLPHGEGLLVAERNNYIWSHFVNGRPSGETFEKFDCMMFQGEYFQGLKIKGVLSTEEFRYEGAFKNNMFSGYGIIQYDNGERYEGDFVNGNYHGDGVYEARNNGIYRGEFINGKFQGKGTFTWPDGGYYQGQYKQGLRNGQGKLYYHGKEVEGEWIDGKLIANNPQKENDKQNQKRYQKNHKPQTPQSKNSNLPGIQEQKNKAEKEKEMMIETRPDLKGYVIQLF